MDKELAILGGEPAVNVADRHYVWPRITEEVRKVVNCQLDETISIYDCSGVFKQFEDSFSSYHDRKYALLHNSGTNAIHAMFFAANISVGDEVICPAYTFFATASPLMNLGAVPVFCDSGDDGNIDPNLVEKLITKKTKAVIITHMWGIPCNVSEFSSLCKKYNLLLFEDCSHAHGATYEGTVVGSQSDAAVWSLQGQKIVSGGEGGILLTNNEDIYTKATLLGHYNNRSKTTLNKSHPLFRFAVTGFGMKHRAHPLAIAIAMNQFENLNYFLERKRIHAELFISALSEFKFIINPKFNPTIQNPSWYAFVFRFKSKESNGVSLKEFLIACRAEGILELDHPGSTKIISDFPLFNSPQVPFPDRYSSDFQIDPNFSAPVGREFFEQGLKLPVWAFLDELDIVLKYCDGLRKVCFAIEKCPEKLIGVVDKF